MKLIFRTAAIAALILTTSCGKDDANSTPQQSEEQAELLEQTPLEANVVSDNVVITGATKENGAPPTPNEAISLDVSDTSKTALLDEGFNISLSSDGNIVGAYLRFKADDGTEADSYYDIDIISNSTDNKSGKRVKSKRRNSSAMTAKIDDAVLDVDFNTTITPGTFCYELCVYDAEGNISSPQEVCVTVESWGGKSELVSKWNLVKEEYIESNGEVDEDIAGVEECTDSTQLCENGTVLEYSECYLLDFAFIVFNDDGTYSMEYKGGENYLDYAPSIANCEATLIDYLYYGKGYGKWAYSSSEERLTLVEYRFIDEGTDGEGLEVYEPGNAYVAYDGKAVITDNALTIIEEDFKSYLEK